MPEATTKSRESAVCMVTKLRRGQSGVRIPVGAKDILIPQSPDQLCEPSSLGFLPGSKATGV